jgi:hypothetical protein
VNISDALAQTKAELLRLDDEITVAQSRLDEVTAKRAQLQADAVECESFLTYQATAVTVDVAPQPLPVTP